MSTNPVRFVCSVLLRCAVCDSLFMWDANELHSRRCVVYELNEGFS